MNSIVDKSTPKKLIPKNLRSSSEDAKTCPLYFDTIQRSIQVPRDIWDAARCVPGGRTRFIINALADAVEARQSELPKLRLEIKEHIAERQRIEALISAKEARIAELLEEENRSLSEAVKIQKNIDQAIVETSRLLEMFRRNITTTHFKRLSDLTGTPVTDIESFIKKHRYRPTEEQIREFYLG
ncbi:hypothetical protein EO98_04770 [Methanosarcina sp. 2.H.T.1A.6]|uniref:hypothetical protein n=1 Tax=unclassified Methanosarcina TaxID=2644672 RepID=UPI0006218844|nr:MULTISPECIES: hypothetical protein [unclassified Methanosarcina]KKG16015.1 hypothetical protein EO94_05210 [Methanosarcina sp. 2.H.T.1A.3]KKG21296.1 hypothetical protein EO98_04770 [Methanosarcina sp. 2.H.T.1A.6]KKG24136.1 hypothetical protein EO96_14155 [Methanosarcina sp. 2.H.T.1A.8]KKG28687.1 hypothetical protein EO97_14855 [Methanosarcina sp. 2.H.T.1A.15]